MWGIAEIDELKGLKYTKLLQERQLARGVSTPAIIIDTPRNDIRLDMTNSLTLSRDFPMLVHNFSSTPSSAFLKGFHGAA